MGNQISRNFGKGDKIPHIVHQKSDDIFQQLDILDFFPLDQVFQENISS